MQVLAYQRAVRKRLGKLSDRWRSSSSWRKINFACNRKVYECKSDYIRGAYGERKSTTRIATNRLCAIFLSVRRSLRFTGYLVMPTWLSNQAYSKAWSRIWS